MIETRDFESFVTHNDLAKPHTDVVSEISWADNSFRPTERNLIVRLEKGINGNVMVRVNKSSLYRIVKKWGNDEEKFIGKKIVLKKGKPVNGKNTIDCDAA